jgi:SSS family transporter
MKTGAMIDYFVLGAYFVILVGIGIYFSKFMKGGKDYFSGGNKLPWWVSGISLYMASFSAWTFTGAAGFVYHTEWFGVLYLLTWSISFLIGSPITAAKWRRTRVISPVEYSRTRYNKPTQQVIGYVMVLNALLGLGLTLTAISKVIASVMGLPIELVILVSGIVILIYTFLGGLWAVAIADVVQFVILIIITIVILPLSLNLVGGIGNLFTKLGTIKFGYQYKGEPYDFIWIFAILLMNIIVAANSAQRFYSVKNEKDAKKVGITTGLLFLTVPILFGIPPLVAKVLWPDLSSVPFFQNQIIPNDLVFVAIVLKILPNGLIGVFMAAMFAATLSTLDSAYNATAAVISKDLYAGIFKPDATDKQIMKFGRVSTFCIGVITIITALLYATSEFGIFNWMMTFVALFIIPMSIPLVYGLLFKDLKRWSGLITIIFGLIIGLIEKYLLGWQFGVQIFGTIILCSVLILSSNLLGKLYLRNKKYIFFISLFITLFFIFWFNITLNRNITISENILLNITPLIIGIGIYLSSILFSKENDEDRSIISGFFKKLDTPINLTTEVYKKGIKEISSFPITGKLTILVGILIFFLSLFQSSFNDILIILFMSLTLIFVGCMMTYFGGRSEKKFMEQMKKEQEKLLP